MTKVSKRFLNRAKPALRKYQRIIEASRDRDVNESDTVVVITDFLSDVLGYDKYEEITTEYSVRRTYCDLAVKVGGDLRFLIEVKAIGKDLRENHLRQAVDYGAREGIEWVLLTNGVEWQAHRLRFEKPIQHDLVITIDLLDADAKPATLLEQLYLLSREAAQSDAIDRFRRQQEATNRFVLAQVVLSEPVVKVVRRELRHLSPELRISDEEVTELLTTSVIKRDAVDGEQAKEAVSFVRRAARRRARRSRDTASPQPEPPAMEAADAGE